MGLSRRRIRCRSLTVGVCRFGKLAGGGVGSTEGAVVFDQLGLELDGPLKLLDRLREVVREGVLLAQYPVGAYVRRLPVQDFLRDRLGLVKLPPRYEKGGKL